MVTVRSLIVCMLPKWCLVACGLSVCVFRGRCLRKIEGKGVEGGAVQFAPAGGDGVGASHEAGGEVADENLATLAAHGINDLIAVGHSSESGENRVLCGLVDLGEDANAGQSCPVMGVEASFVSNTGNGIARAYAEGIERVRCSVGVRVVPSGGGLGDLEVASQLSDYSSRFAYCQEHQQKHDGRGRVLGGGWHFARMTQGGEG